MHNVLSLKQKKRKPPHKVHLASLTHGEARLNHKTPFWSDFTTYSFVFDTSVCQSPSSAHKLINTKKKVDCTGLKFLYLCMYACKRDEIQLHVYFLLDYLCVFIYIYIYIHVCVWGLHASFFGSTYKHTAQKMYEPWIYERGRTEQRRERLKALNGHPIKTGTTHGEPLSAAILLSSDKMHIALILQWLWHNPGLLSLSVIRGVLSCLQVVRNVSH